MNVQFNPNISGAGGISGSPYGPRVDKDAAPQSDFMKAIEKSLSGVNKDQQEANVSIVDLLSGKEQDVNTVVATMAKADMSFKMLVGVRNKLVEAYKETMRMQI